MVTNDPSHDVRCAAPCLPTTWLPNASTQAAKLTTSNPTTPVYDRYDLNEPPSHNTPNQRQQSSLVHRSPLTARSTPGPERRLRRTPNFSATPSPRSERQQQKQKSPPRVAVTLSPTGRYVLAKESPRRKRTPDRPRATRQLSQDHLTTSSVATSSQSSSFRDRITQTTFDSNPIEPHPIVRISKHTHLAVLYTLEATLRGPKPLSIDPVEQYAQMADLMGGRGPATSNGNGSSSIRAPSGRPTATGSPSGIIGPKQIMAQRAEREARREKERKEQERLQREHLEAEARAQAEAERREAERRAVREAEERKAASAGAGTYPNASTQQQPQQMRMEQPSSRPNQVPSTNADPSNSRRAAQQPDPGRTSTTYPHIASQAPRPAHNEPSASRPAQSGAGAEPNSAPTLQPQAPGLAANSSAIGRGRNSFPHAFERWETLSAYWEGLTSFWIRRLEQNSTEIQNDSMQSQLARQVTDLSSAGANLFHAMVELQRLRASSERKFQRWFMETRTELERHHEITAMLEASLEEERRSRDDAIRQALEQDQGSTRLQKQIVELRKELTISKEEARRAWEELGRREQEERERTMSLQSGQPTIVGGVQVVPMTQGVSRGNSSRDPRYAQPEVQDYNQPPTPRGTRAEYSQAPAVQPVTTSAGNPVMQTPSSVHHQQSYGSEGDFSEEEFETPATQPATYQAPVSVPEPPQYGAPTPDYSGSGYQDWEPRHHHPTRLSDVLEEEEERSRTSASQVSHQR
ncbi:hypothetical protein F5Y16DRAFT_416584 [Xylariaceae sp. FL0255]|nr:hypothetical protein F5Y16DRAFT_416584 [Xylariaceae sp. FL0255]